MYVSRNWNKRLKKINGFGFVEIEVRCFRSIRTHVSVLTGPVLIKIGLHA